ncbi:MAG: hypothetical protein KI790_15415 [Cyclobacteriaceae bacterium]|nr:hypothetical protein [Cyclobacteriaceae bacterium HetDA_MAG_MS6]
MKFPKTQFEDITGAILDTDRDPEGFDLINRKGWVHVQRRSSGDFFAYFCKKKVILSEIDNRWVEVEYFRIKTKYTEQREFDQWSDVIVCFRKWLWSDQNSGRNE